MNREIISHKRLWAWLAAAMMAPFAHFSGGSWLGLLTTGLVIGGIMMILPVNMEMVKGNRILCTVELIWSAVLIGQFLPLTAVYWPGEKSDVVVPLTILVLAAYGCGKRPSRVAAVIFWIVVLLMIPVLAAGVKDLETEWLVPTSMNCNEWLIPILLIPMGAGFLPSEKRNNRMFFLILGSGVVISAITAGVLSPEVTAKLDAPMRELGRSLSIGAASRFESVISVIVTLEWYSLISLLIRIGCEQIEVYGLSKNLSPWITASLAVILWLTGIRISGLIAAITTAALWIIVPKIYEVISVKKEKKGT